MNINFFCLIVVFCTVYPSFFKKGLFSQQQYGWDGYGWYYFHKKFNTSEERKKFVSSVEGKKFLNKLEAEEREWDKEENSVARH